MKTTRNYQLEEDIKAAVEHASRHDKRPEVRLRCLALLALHRGETPSQVAEWCGVHRRTIYWWHDRFLAGGIEGLADKARTGRPPKATPAYIQAIEEALAQPPSAYGYDFALWTVARLCAHLTQVTNIELSPRALHSLLARLGYVYRRPKTSLKQLQNKEAVAQARQNWEALKGGPRAHTTPTAPTSSSLWTRPH